MSCAIMSEPIEMLSFGMWSRWVQESVIRWESRSPWEGAILRAKSSRPRTCLDMYSGRYTQSDSAGGRTGKVQMLIGVY